MTESVDVKYYFEFHDGNNFEVEEHFVYSSTVFTNMIEDITEEDSNEVKLPIPNNYPKDMYIKLYQNYMKIYNKDSNYFNTVITKLKNNGNDFFSLPENKNLNEIDSEIKFEKSEYSDVMILIQIADFLNLEAMLLILTKICSNEIANSINDDDDESLHQLFGNPDMPINENDLEEINEKRALFNEIKSDKSISI